MENSTHKTLLEAVRKDSNLLIFLGILTAALGIFAMLSPIVAGIAVAIWVGALLIVAGILRTVFAFKAKSWGRGILTLIVGLITLLCGLLMVARPGLALASLTLLLAVYFIVEGAFEIVASMRLSPVHGWGWVLFSGILSLILGVMIWSDWPLSGAWAVGVLVGIKLLFAGIAIAVIGFAGRRTTDLFREAHA